MRCGVGDVCLCVMVLVVSVMVDVVDSSGGQDLLITTGSAGPAVQCLACCTGNKVTT